MSTIFRVFPDKGSVELRDKIVVAAGRVLERMHARLTGLFEPHRDQLATSPEIAAIALRSLIFGASRPELGMTTVLTPEQIADLLLGGVLRREG